MTARLVSALVVTGVLLVTGCVAWGVAWGMNLHEERR